MLETCLSLRRRLGNPVEIAATLSTLSLARLQEGDAIGAGESEREALQIFRQLGDRFGEAIGLQHLGQIGIYVANDEQARVHLDQCLAIARAIRHQEVEGECELMLGEIGFEAGDLEQACLRFKRSLTVCREAGDKRGEANALRWLGKADLERGELASARRRLGDALRTFRAFEMWEELLGCLEDHAAVVRAEGRPDLAVHLSAAAAASRDKLGLGRPPRIELRWQAHLDALRTTLSTPVFDEAWRGGREWEVDQAIRRALSTQEEAVAA
jgi:tetratricopeptide (TPR) repeat protein